MESLTSTVQPPTFNLQPVTPEAPGTQLHYRHLGESGSTVYALGTVTGALLADRMTVRTTSGARKVLKLACDADGNVTGTVARDGGLILVVR